MRCILCSLSSHHSPARPRLSRPRGRLWARLFQAFDKFLCEAQVEQLHGGEFRQVRESLDELLPTQLQEVGNREPDLKERASSFVLVNVDNAAMDVHAASLGMQGNRGLTIKGICLGIHLNSNAK